MQFIESSSFGVRAASYRLKSPSNPIEVLLCPMVHIGTQPYFEKIRSTLAECDEIFLEGVASFRVRVLTTCYRWVARRRNLRLVDQRQGLQLQGLPARLVRCDASGREFESDWRQIPWHLRLGLMVLAPLFGAWLYMTASRRSLGRRLALDDLESRDEIQSWGAVPGFRNAVVESRDSRLVRAIEHSLSQANAPGLVGVVYGAAHMRFVLAHLSKIYGYRVEASEWVVVMDYDVDG